MFCTKFQNYWVYGKLSYDFSAILVWYEFRAVGNPKLFRSVKHWWLRKITYLIYQISLVELFADVQYKETVWWLSWYSTIKCTSQWRHNERDGVSNHRCLHCFLNCWFRRRSKKTSKLRLTCLCAGNSPVTTPDKRRKMFPYDDVIMNRTEKCGSFPHVGVGIKLTPPWI